MSLIMSYLEKTPSSPVGRTTLGTLIAKDQGETQIELDERRHGERANRGRKPRGAKLRPKFTAGNTVDQLPKVNARSLR